MPYIKKEDRVQYDRALDCIKEIETKGDLEYCVSKLMKTFMSTREFRYSTLHEVAYAVQHCADEHRRLNLDKREDEAREQNGDV
ncbi:MAG: DUF6899 family protein [Candidatus Heimdallarchaeota archaeon]